MLPEHVVALLDKLVTKYILLNCFSFHHFNDFMSNLLEELLRRQVLAVLLVLAGDDHVAVFALAVLDGQRELALLVAHGLDRRLYRRVADPVIPGDEYNRGRLFNVTRCTG